MSAVTGLWVVNVFALLSFLAWVLSCVEGLSVGFYQSRCSDAEDVVRSTVEKSIQSDSTIAAALLRLHYHDCFVEGCDGSVLIDGPNAEKNAGAHNGLRGFEVIQNAKQQLERLCPNTVSCADIVALAARDAVALSNGPDYQVPTGRRDGLVSREADAANMPDPTDSISLLKKKFAAKGLSDKDLVLLNAAHTIGTAACAFVKDRLYDFNGRGGSDPSMSADYVAELQGTCPRNGGDLNRVALDRGSATDFDDSFLRNVRDGYGILESDSKMYEDGSTASYIDSYLGPLSGLLGPSFFDDFAESMVKLGQIGVKTSVGNSKIRPVCSRL